MRSILLFIGLFSVLFASAQKHDNTWLTGYDSNYVDTTFGGSVMIFPNETRALFYEFRPMDFNATNASISDANGNLLFYTNGIYIANALNEMMENGDSLDAGAFSHDSGLRQPQGALILPAPSDTNFYYLFHQPKDLEDGDLAFHSSKLYYSLIDIRLDDGWGSVVEKNQIIIDEKIFPGNMTAVKHANGRDWWILVADYFLKEYYSILLSDQGIERQENQEIGSGIRFPGLGQAKFSPDGSKYATLNLVSLAEGNFIDIYDFDRCSGLLSNNIQIPYADSATIGGLEFSPNSRFLYISSDEHVYQYDLLANDIEASREIVAIYDGWFEEGFPFLRSTFLFAQLAPDGKIYICTGNTTRKLHVINQPNLPGLACDLQQHAIQTPTFNSFTVPNFPNFRLGPLEDSPCDTLLTSTTQAPTNSTLQVYPNPASDVVTITKTGDSSASFSWVLYNSYGQQVLSTNLSDFQMEQAVKIHHLPAGLYFWKVLQDKQLVQQGKLMIIRNP